MNFQSSLAGWVLFLSPAQPLSIYQIINKSRFARIFVFVLHRLQFFNSPKVKTKTLSYPHQSSLLIPYLLNKRNIPAFPVEIRVIAVAVRPPAHGEGCRTRYINAPSARYEVLYAGFGSPSLYETKYRCF
jgi:hypothetical protein